MSKRPNDRKGEIPQDRAAERTPSMISDAAGHSGVDTAAEQRPGQTMMEPSLCELPRDPGNPGAVLMPQEPIAKPQPDRDGIIPAAMASLWRAMLALPTGHPALRSLQKCEDADLAEAVPMLKMCAAALRLVHLQASAEHVERALELLSGLSDA